MLSAATVIVAAVAVLAAFVATVPVAAVVAAYLRGCRKRKYGYA